MIKQLRKRHLQIWALWAVLIPVGIIAAWMAVPKKVTDDLNRVINSAPTLPQQTITTDSIIASVEKENYKLNILLPNTVNSESPIRLEYTLNLQFINKKELTTPSLLLYRMTDPAINDIDKQELLGRIESKGTQYFQLKISNLPISNRKFDYKDKFILYDIIKKQTIDSLIFKTPL